MPPRLGYRKSRAGCLKCKERRIKCDEKVPCTACLKHGITCSLCTTSASRSRQPVAQRLFPKQLHSSPIARNKISVRRDARAQGDFESTSQRMTELGFMHHFTAVTWSTLPRGNERQQTWQLALPRLAMQHDFLMHQLLALAAHHMAALYPDRSHIYSIKAAEHQSTATQGLHSVVLDVTKDTCHAVFASALLLAISTFATNAEQVVRNSPKPTLDNLLEIFSLLRGMHKILKGWENEIGRGPMGKLLELDHGHYDTPLLTHVAQRLEQELLDKDSLEDSTVLDAVTAFIECIQDSCTSSLTPELRLTHIWPLHFSDGYFSLLQSRNAHALRILDYYAEILQATETFKWYMQGWGGSIRTEIAQLLQPN